MAKSGGGPRPFPASSSEPYSPWSGTAGAWALQHPMLQTLMGPAKGWEVQEAGEQITPRGTSGQGPTHALIGLRCQARDPTLGKTVMLRK